MDKLRKELGDTLKVLAKIQGTLTDMDKAISKIEQTNSAHSNVADELDEIMIEHVSSIDDLFRSYKETTDWIVAITSALSEAGIEVDVEQTRKQRNRMN